MFILRRYKSEKVAGFLWNRWPTSNGISGRNEMEWVAGFAWNHWPAWSGIRMQIEKTFCRLLHL